MLCNSCDRDSLAARYGRAPYVATPSPERPHLVGGRRTIWRFCVRRLLALEAFLGGGARELAVLHAAKTQKLVCQFVDAFAVALQSENLKAVVVIEVHVHGRDNLVREIVLDGVEPAREIAGVMVVDHRERAYDLGIGGAQLVLYKGRTDKVADGLGAVGRTSRARDLRVKGRQQIGGNGDGEAGELARGGVRTQR